MQRGAEDKGWLAPEDREDPDEAGLDPPRGQRAPEQTDETANADKQKAGHRKPPPNNSPTTTQPGGQGTPRQTISMKKYFVATFRWL
jgi:hypothetical protein